MEQVQIVTTNPDIKTVADLKGKTVSIGAAGSGVYFNAIDVLQAYGMTEKDITPVYQSFADSADSLKDGKIDAAFIVAGAPTTAITDLATSGSVYLVSLDDTHGDVSHRREQHPRRGAAPPHGGQRGLLIAQAVFSVVKIDSSRSRPGPAFL